MLSSCQWPWLVHQGVGLQLLHRNNIHASATSRFLHLYHMLVQMRSDLSLGDSFLGSEMRWTL